MQVREGIYEPKEWVEYNKTLYYRYKKAKVICDYPYKTPRKLISLTFPLRRVEGP